MKRLHSVRATTLAARGLTLRRGKKSSQTGFLLHIVAHAYSGMSPLLSFKEGQLAKIVSRAQFEHLASVGKRCVMLCAKLRVHAIHTGHIYESTWKATFCGRLCLPATVH